jgi:uncharacterized protein YaaR (DUF327 family)
MEKIDSLGEAFPKKSLKKSKSHKKENVKYKSIFGKVEAQEKTFLSNDNERYPEPEYEEIEELLKEIYNVGDRLKALPTFENIKKYKVVVKTFLKYVTQKMIGVEEKTSGTNILKRKRFTLIKIIDTKVEQLSLEFLKNQEEQIELLSKIDEINGLIIDILK